MASKMNSVSAVMCTTSLVLPFRPFDLFPEASVLCHQFTYLNKALDSPAPCGNCTRFYLEWKSKFSKACKTKNIFFTISVLKVEHLVIFGNLVFCFELSFFPSLCNNRTGGVKGGFIIFSCACLLTFLVSTKMECQQEIRRDLYC